MTRPVVHHPPETNTVVSFAIEQRTIDKIDLLFMIDDSASMSDKQAYLKLAIPDLINRLVIPNCVDDDDKFVERSVPDTNGIPQCSKGILEFPPVHDLHIGIVSSSLGPHGGTECGGEDGNARARLIARTPSKSAIAETAPSNFLAFQPDVRANEGKAPPVGATAIKKIDALTADFEDMIAGVGEAGCGLEGQLESWYRFLIQPDPYQDIQPGGALAGVDAVLLKQRHDFLRPDSLVAIIDVTDENDSEIDTRWNKNYGARFYINSNTKDGWIPAHATASCAKDPMGPDCHSCDKLSQDCQSNRFSTDMTAKEDYDNIGLRHFHMKQRYGIDPQFPLDRYVRGLSEDHVPDRDGEYPSGATVYRGDAHCVNPLFATKLPDGSDTSADALCHLPPSTNVPGMRRKEMVIYAHIGGVPNQLLMDSETGAPKAKLNDDDWQKVLGRDPERYDFSGIDPHMIESISPRAGLAVPNSADDADPVHGREWDTSNKGSDLQYACTFQLATPKSCSKNDSCDCPKTVAEAADRSKVPPLCDKADPTVQTKAKTYPTTRELLLAKKMGAQGVAASLCPIHVQDNATKSDPLYGYRPAVTSIVDAIKRQFTVQCIPHKILPSIDDATKHPCLALEIEPKAGPQSTCDSIPGRVQPDADVLARFRKTQAELAIKNGTPDTSQQPVCAVNEIANVDGASCKHSKDAGWCYVEGDAAPGACTQAILFSAAGIPIEGAALTIQCFEKASSIEDE